ncbi:MAG: transposase, partial [Methylocella sp.]
GIEALGPKPRTANPAPGTQSLSHMLRDLTIERPNQVWAADIAYIPTGRGFLCLVAVNTDQGSQFTSADFTDVLIEADVRISMDGRGRWMDNVFIERVWRSLKYEDVYLKGYADGREAKAGIGDWITFYNERRLHQALAYRAPMAGWRDGAAHQTFGHVDNANALTTGPQAEKQKQTEPLAA